jgi:SAM-dependent methyltransferase
MALMACPRCHGTLSSSDVGDDGAALTCAGCGAAYPVVGGIPRFVGSDHYAASFGEQWNRHRQTQLDSHTGLPISRTRLFSSTGWSERLDNQAVLEAGSGAGRFTEALVSTGATVCSFDYSSAVEANFTNHGHRPNLLLFQADIFAMPVKSGRFDKVLCLGVLQHTPDPAGAFRSLAEKVRPGGELVVDVYPKRLSALLSWKYVLRPITRRMKRDRLFRLVERAVDVSLPLGPPLRKLGGRAGVRLLPVCEYSHLGLTPALAREWAVLDSFDMYAPAHDHPQTRDAVAGWFADAGFDDVHVAAGPNGFVGRGRRRA